MFQIERPFALLSTSEIHAGLFCCGDILHTVLRAEDPLMGVEDMLADAQALRISDRWHVIVSRSEVQPDRLRRLVHVFIRSECEEATIRIALADAAPLYRDVPEARAAKASA